MFLHRFILLKWGEGREGALHTRYKVFSAYWKGKLMLSHCRQPCYESLAVTTGYPKVMIHGHSCQSLIGCDGNSGQENAWEENAWVGNKGWILCLTFLAVVVVVIDILLFKKKVTPLWFPHFSLVITASDVGQSRSGLTASCHVWCKTKPVTGNLLSFKYYNPYGPS